MSNIRGMRLADAQEILEMFEEDFGQAHLYFAQHAAFPLALTPDLLYRLWINFQRNIRDEKLSIPWIAVADLLLSSLCKEVGHELYEMDITVRAELLNALKNNEDFGMPRIYELSDFLLNYVHQQVTSHNARTLRLAQAQQWTALAYTRPNQVTLELAEALDELSQDSAEQIRVVSIIETLDILAEPLASFEGFAPLLTRIKNGEGAHQDKVVERAGGLVKNSVKGAGLGKSVQQHREQKQDDFKDDSSRAHSYLQLASIAHERREFEQAEQYLQQALQIFNDLKDDSGQAATYQQLGRIAQEQQQLAQAESLFQRALAIRERLLGEEHPDTASSLNNLANIYYTQQKYEQAEPFYQRALAIREKVLGPEHPDTGKSLNNLAWLYYRQGQVEKAVPLSQRALAIREKVLDPEHLDIANSLNILALLYRNQGKNEQAEQLFRRALVIYEKMLGPEHPDTVWILENLGSLFLTQLQYEKAEPFYQRALTIRETMLGPEHADTARALDNLGSLYRNQGQYDKAESFFQRVLAIREKVLGPEHLDTAQALDNLGSLYRDHGQYDKAEPLYQRALAIREKVLGPEHADTARALDNLGSLYRDHGQYDKAEPLYQRALAIREKVLGPEHLDTAQALDNLGLLYRIQLQDDKAEPLYQRALAIREKMLGPKYAHTMHLQGAAELEAFITVKGDNEAADDAVRRLVVEAQVLALGAPAQGASGTAHLLHCTVPVGGTKIAMLPVFTRMEHVVAAVQMNPAWQSLQVLQMAGSVVLGDLEEEEWLGINPWSGHEFKLPATPSTNLPPAH